MVSNAAFLLCCLPTIGFGSALACLGEIEGFTRIDSQRETREGGEGDKATCPQWDWDTAQLIGACKMIRATWAYQCQAQTKGGESKQREREKGVRDLLWIVNIKNITKEQRPSTGPVKWNITTHQILACTNKHVPVCVCTFSFHSFLVANALWLMSILFANISLMPSLSLFVVISVYCFLYIFQLERTKSYSKCQSSYLAKPSPLPIPPSLLLLLVGAFVCVMSLFCALPWGAETRNCRVNMFYIHFPDWWLPLRVGNGIACGRGRALHMRTFCLYFSILQSGNVSITCAQIELSRERVPYTSMQCSSLQTSLLALLCWCFVCFVLKPLTFAVNQLSLARRQKTKQRLKGKAKAKETEHDKTKTEQKLSEKMMEKKKKTESLKETELVGRKLQWIGRKNTLEIAVDWIEIHIYYKIT